MAEYTQTRDYFELSSKPAFQQPEIGRDLCRVEYGGYRKDIVTENLNEREQRVLLCKICQGIMKDACISSSGEQFCLCCKKEDSKESPHITVRETINSLKCSCPLIERGCKWLGTLEDCESHLDTCDYVREACKLKCGAVIRRDKLRIHEKECLMRDVKCDHCEKNFKFYQLNKHLDKCPKMIVLCVLCNTQITREDTEQHIMYDCVMVREKCKLGCGVKLTRDELKIHENDTCEQRKVRCEHCYNVVKFCDIPKHLKKCPEVVLSCDLCGLEKCRKDMTEHLKDDCPEKMADCPFVKYKCLAHMKRKHMVKHLEEKETKHLGLKLTAMEEEINRLTVKIEEQNQEMVKKEEEITEKLYSITDTIEIVWKIANVTDLVKGSDSSGSIQFEFAGYRFSFSLNGNGELGIVFQAIMGRKCDKPFKAKCRVVFRSQHASYLKNIFNCGIIEVKQKDLTRSCERKIASISEEIIEKCSEPNVLNPSKKDLTLEIYLTMQ